MRRLMSVTQSVRVGLGLMVTYRFNLEDNKRTHNLFGHQPTGVLKCTPTHDFPVV